MTMIPELATIVERAAALPPEEQRRIAASLADVLEQSSASTLEEDLKDPAYRAHLERELAEAQADRLAGRVSPAKEVMERLRAYARELHE